METKDEVEKMETFEEENERLIKDYWNERQNKEFWFNLSTFLIIVVVSLMFVVVFQKFKIRDNNKFAEEVSLLNEQYYSDIMKAEIYVEYIEEFAKYEIEIAELESKIKYLEEHIELIIDNKVAQTEEYNLEKYLNAMNIINQELVNYGIYLGYDGKIYKME